MDMGDRRTWKPDWGRVLNDQVDLADLSKVIGHQPKDAALFEQALTHGSHSADHYQRLEFLGDRVLGLTIADWLYRLYTKESEGQLSKRLNALVSGQVCAQVAREAGIGPFMRLGKQANDDGGRESDNILGDVTEALIGALFLDGGMEPAQAFIHHHWDARVKGEAKAPQHPKSALQEWAAASNRKTPVYEVSAQSGPPHNPRFTVTVRVGKLEASAEGNSKQDAETAAAAALLEQIQ